MSKIKELFESGKFKSAFIPYFTLGDPNYNDSIEFGKTILDGGADILELGIPFSDPVADGPVIQRAVARSLKNKFSFDEIFRVTKQIHLHKQETPLVYLTYFNPIYHCGITKFLDNAKDSGVVGLVIPDLPFDTIESETLFQELRLRDMDLIHLVTPASTKKRIEALRKTSTGFIYYVTSFGVTGERREFSVDLKERIRFLKDTIQLPICAGFGISTPEQASQIAGYADGIIIGSAIQRVIEENGQDASKAKNVLADYITKIRASIS
ncbi:Tryptophan synthase alpha chain [Leptospira biflexa serovar Patoc strain 'Patoc 1 (Ames)']|uniref:Tryptophan synthase alpha chain n=2 Tax=Leptospira biflexa serovar Patoc TaxID=145259 RepID=TRPA_LEPBP|nr:tryptophan synthase subunit alpha [Leptospira biflexa]B0SDM7.1 RecName: Full=Tryptophan synthase alpha chain [Leptospira biflexa serovar Patoc strain 'Patoc 1 (Ames)']Q5MI53.1 RecName: Full=Tryptophan synthase alpha chain [Leptospira biflexa serovar Patoc strain 'Patoc 1 (Paris)']AAV85863.1 TrpA [Leptospira biflexa serovar Patoc strain 'Patoc 1 (Paris)']ABZ95011.1 Tryptophan synthase alpha chain [Leptospira biflexa serovar Patoc strain 'Patoc 1 (Ames)']ABZ98686.1 Tryptophan synthase alpha p